MSKRRSYLNAECETISTEIGVSPVNRNRSVRNGQVLPHRQQLGATSDARFRQHDLVEAEAVLEEVEEALVLQEEGDVVEGGDVVDSENLLVGDVAEHGDLGDDGEGERRRAAACDLKSDATR